MLAAAAAGGGGGAGGAAELLACLLALLACLVYRYAFRDYEYRSGLGKKDWRSSSGWLCFS